MYHNVGHVDVEFRGFDDDRCDIYQWNDRSSRS